MFHASRCQGSGSKVMMIPKTMNMEKTQLGYDILARSREPATTAADVGRVGAVKGDGGEKLRRFPVQSGTRFKACLAPQHVADLHRQHEGVPSKHGRL